MHKLRWEPHCSIIVALMCIALLGLIIEITIYARVTPTQHSLAAQLDRQITTKRSTPPSRHTTLNSCPPDGQGRRAVVTSLAHGQLPHILYLQTNDIMNGPSSVMDFDVLHNDSSEVTHGEIKESLVSANGTWLLTLVHSNGHDEVRLLRLDEKDEQTLYCSPNGAQLESMQWSPDQSYIAWSLISATDKLPDLYLLNLHSGQVTRVAQATRDKGYQPGSWLNAGQLLVKDSLKDGSSQALYVLDITKKPRPELRQIFQPQTPLCWDYVASSDGKTLYISECAGGNSIYRGPSTISALHLGSNKTEEIWHSDTMAVTALRFAAKSGKPLLAIIGNSAPGMQVPTELNGLWMISTSGEDSTIAVTNKYGEYSTFADLRDPWSNISRDGTMYVLHTTSNEGQGDKLYYGVLGGGIPAQFANIAEGGTLEMIGWTEE